MPEKFQIERVITGVYRQKVGELEFTDRKCENWSLQIESRRTGVYRVLIESRITKVYRQKEEELDFTDRKQENKRLQNIDRKQENKVNRQK